MSLFGPTAFQPDAFQNDAFQIEFLLGTFPTIVITPMTVSADGGTTDPNFIKYMVRRHIVRRNPRAHVFRILWGLKEPP